MGTFKYKKKPLIQHFKEGTVYEQKPSFTDGTVKTLADFVNEKWEQRRYTIRDKPYIERALNGANAERGLCGIRILLSETRKS